VHLALESGGAPDYIELVRSFSRIGT